MTKEDNHVCEELPEGFLGKEAPEVSNRLLFHGESPDEEDLTPIVQLGSGLELMYDRKVELTHERAQEHLELAEFIVDGARVDRDLDNKHVETLIALAKSGQFHPEWVQLVTCELMQPNPPMKAHTKYRMNGQHTAWMRLYMPVDWRCSVRILDYRAKTLPDMRLLYASIDRGKARTRGNVTNSLLGGTSLFGSMAPRIVAIVASGLSLWLFPRGKGTSTGDVPAEKIAYLLQRDYRSEAQRVITYIASCPATRAVRKNLIRTSVVAAMFETIPRLPSRAHEFWDVVRDGVGVSSVTDPRHLLRDLLLDAAISGSAHGRAQVPGAKRCVTREELYRICVKCWNAWRDGKEMKVLRADDKRVKAK